MYKTGFITLLLFSMNVHAVDYKKANPILQSLANEITKTETLVTDFYPEFDESYSDLSKGRLKYDAEATLTDPPWKNSHQAKVTASTSYILHSSSSKSAIEVKFRAKVETDMLAFAQHAGGIALKVKAYDYHSDVTESAKNKTLMDDLSTVSRFEDLAALVIKGQERAIEVIDLELARGIGVYEKTAFTKEKDAYDKMLVSETKTNGVVTELKLFSPDATKFLARYNEVNRGIYNAGASTLTLKEDSIELETSLVINISNYNAYQMKTSLNDVLTGINKGDSKSEDQVRAAYKSALKQFKHVVIDENPFN